MIAASAKRPDARILVAPGIVFSAILRIALSAVVYCSGTRTWPMGYVAGAPK
jgi:hypothetical protein